MLMNILAIDTSTSYAGVALQYRGDSWTRSWVSQHNHGRELMPHVLELLQSAGCHMSELDCVAVALGPGGFSAVRVGVSCALGIANPGGTTTVGIPTHYLQAYAYAHAKSGAVDAAPDAVVSLIPIGRDQLSAAKYAMPLGDIHASSEHEIVSVADIASRRGAEDMEFCGEGQFAVSSSLKLDSGVNPRRPEVMLEIAGATIRDGLERHWDIRPIYAREPTITRPRNATAGQPQHR